MNHHFNTIVIGSGPGGYVAAIAAAQQGQKVALIEKENLGGICLNWGCVPTKALLRAADVFHTMQQSHIFGVNTTQPTVSWDKLVQRSRAVVTQLTSGIAHLMKKNHITILKGHGCLRSKKEEKFIVSVGQKEVTANHVILATGARAKTIPGFSHTSSHIWTYRDALLPKKQPASLLIIGSGAIGVEFASFFNTFGTKVTLIEQQDRILPVEDTDVSHHVHQALTKQGIDIYTETTGTYNKQSTAYVEIKLQEKNKKYTIKKYDKILLAVGIEPNTENIGIENTKIICDKKHIVTDGYGQTTEPGIYAIGDVAGTPWLAHKASHEGVIAITHITNGSSAHPLDHSLIPSCVYASPEVGRIGLTETEAKDKGHQIKVGHCSGVGNGKAIAYGDTTSFVKVIFDVHTGELLGAHMVGPNATEQIQGFVIAKKMEATEEDLMHTIFPHPTLSEMMHEAVLDAWGKALHA